MVVFRDGGFADDRHLFINRPFARKVECYEKGTGRPIDCEPLEAKRREALDRLFISDNVLRRDLVPDLLGFKSPLTFKDMGPPKAVSPELGLNGVRIDQLNMVARPPSGATSPSATR